MKKITIAADSFKGSLSSRQVADAFAEGVKSVSPDCVIRKVYVADGGEGTVEALVAMSGGEVVDAEVCDPLMRRVVAHYGLIDDAATAVIEMASASGLTRLSVEERNPLKTSTFGTGELIADALRCGARKLLIGIGGSATNDAGMGMLRALGFRFLDGYGQELAGCGEDLSRVESIDRSGVAAELRQAEILVACDVQNPLYGEQGAAYIYAPQKGADALVVEQLDCGLRHFAEVVKAHNGADVADVAGAGAAGGLGYTFMALLGARLVRGIDMMLEAAHFDDVIRGCDLVVTGEGRIDSQTLMGKAPSGVLQAAMRQGVPTVAIGGAVEMCDELRESGFAAIIPIADASIPLEVAMRSDVAEENVRLTAAKIAREFFMAK